MASLTLIAAREYVVPGARLDDLPTVREWLWSITAVREWLGALPGLRAVFVAKDDEPVSPREDTLTVPVPDSVLARFDRERDGVGRR